jgi:ABC-2 type transport system permease protein
MKLFDITRKDLIQASRSFFALAFMFVVPVLVTLLFALMFGGVKDRSLDLPQTAVAVANLDEGRLPAGYAQGLPADLAAGDAQSMGELLIQILQGEDLQDLLLLTPAADEAAARAAVETGQVGVALIIPANFSAAMLGNEEAATVQLVKDPTLSFGPVIVEAIVSQVLDTFAAGQIGMRLVLEDLSAAGVPVDAALIQEAMAQVTAGSQAGAAGLVSVVHPAGSGDGADLFTTIVGTILAGMLVFFAFFTGSASLESILAEEERGTLARLFTTPTSTRTILGAKMLAAVVTLGVQVSVLLLFGRFVFGIKWGALPAVVLAGLGVVIAAAATGVLLVSLLKNTGQGGLIYGGVLTVAGMIGLLPVFTAGTPDRPGLVETISLAVPQGWAARGLLTAMNGGDVAAVLPVFGVLLLWSAVFLAIGQWRLGRRFA